MKNKTSAVNYILRDVLPSELPLIYSNKNLFEYLKQNDKYLACDCNYSKLTELRTIPMNFYIRKGEFGIRKMSLMHPYMQVLATKFIHDYANLIITYFENNKLFSIRTPIGINDKERIISEKYIHEIKEMLLSEVENQNNDLKELITNYFNLSRFPKLTDFYRSYYLKDLEVKYTFLTKIDIQNCFESIYTHSVDWAYLGKKEVAKENTTNKERFSYIIDSLMQNMNYGETNGILIGPEFSRLFAEIILTRLDNLLFNKLQSLGIYYKRDYEIIRFIDDIYIFTNSIEVASLVEKEVEYIFSEYKLHINHEKRIQEVKPFLRDHLWISPVKETLNKFSDFIDNIEGKKKGYGYNNFYNDIRNIIVEYESHKRYIASYVLSSLENMEITISEKLSKLDSSIKYFHACRLIDLVTQIVNYAINYDNILKLSRIFLKLLKLSNDDPLTLDDIIYKKAFLLINYNKDNISEMLNLIITLAYVKEKVLPPNLLIELLEKNPNYLIISTIAFYVYKADPKQKYYLSVIEKINALINNILIECGDYYGINYKSSSCPGGLMNFLMSDRFYIIHDFYSYPFLNYDNKKKIGKIKSFIRPVQPNDKNEVLRVFTNYIKDFDKPFMQWEATYNNIVTDFFLVKQLKQISYS